MYKIYTKFPIQSKQQLSKDHVFGLSKIHLLEKFICLIMKNGQKYKAYKILYKTLNIIKKKIGQNRFPGRASETSAQLSTCDASSIFSNFFTERASAKFGGLSRRLRSNRTAQPRRALARNARA